MDTLQKLTYARTCLQGARIAGNEEDIKSYSQAVNDLTHELYGDHKYHISASLGDGRLLHKSIYADSVGSAISKFMQGDDIPEDFNRSVSFTIVKYPEK